MFLTCTHCFIYLFMATTVLHCYRQAFSSCGEQGLLSSSSAQASLCSGFSCCRAQVLGEWVSVLVAQGLSSCSSRALEHRLSSCDAQWLHGMWNPPGPGLEPVSPTHCHQGSLFLSIKQRDKFTYSHRFCSHSELYFYWKGVLLW